VQALLKVAGRKVERHGFTLIELLVVIAIIAILAAILFPVFLKARDNAKLARCMVHLKECGSAGIMYLDNWDGRFPVPRIRNEDGTVMASRSWCEGQCVGGNYGHLDDGPKDTVQPSQVPPAQQVYQVYRAVPLPIREAAVMRRHRKHVPLVPLRQQLQHERGIPLSGYTNCFFYTLVVYKGGELDKDFYGRKISEIKRPQRMIFMGERPIHAFWGKSGANAKPDNFLGHDGDRPRTPIVFCDGHVDYILMTPGLNGPRWALAQRGWCPFAPNEGD
jgi:prepilin-type N-terminal cleavage/methylation domain-containing protein/prepilin-type processing-associated H-X9-DG protein